MKKTVLFALVMLLAVSIFAANPVNSAFADGEKINVINWGDYIDPDLIEEFEAETGISVTYQEFDTNEIMATQVRNTSGIDLLAPSEYTIQRLMSEGKLQPIGAEDKANLWSNVDPIFEENINATFHDIVVNGEHLDMTDYFVPYMWGTLGILYNADVVTEDDLAKGWGLLWNANNNPNLVGKIYMKDSIRDIYVAAVMYLKETNSLPEKFVNTPVNELINTVDQELIDAAEAILIKQREQKILLGVDQNKEDLIAGKAYMDLSWSGDAVYAIEEAAANGVNLAYFVPESGSNIWFDGWVIPKNAQNVEGAKKFIEFLNRPENAIRNMIYIGYTSGVSKEILMANEDVRTILEENEYDFDEFFANEVQYHTGTMPMGVMKDFGSSEADLVNMWQRVKSHGNDASGLIIGVVIGVVVVGVVIAVIIVSKNKAGSRRRVVK